MSLLFTCRLLQPAAAFRSAACCGTARCDCKFDVLLGSRLPQSKGKQASILRLLSICAVAVIASLSDVVIADDGDPAKFVLFDVAAGERQLAFDHSLRFINRTKAAVQVFWLDAGGNVP